MSDPERDLILRASRGDHAALEDLLQRCLPDLHGYVRANLGAYLQARESTSDLVQSTCREVLNDLDQALDLDAESFRRWLYTSAARKIKDRYRYHRAEKRGGEADAVRAVSGFDPLEQLCQTLGTPSQAVAREEQLAQLRGCLSQLEPGDREIIQLAYVEGLPHREIAARLELTESHARVRLSRALTRLSKLLPSE